MATIAAYSQIASAMLPDLPGVDAAVASFYLRRAGRKFCQDSEAYVVEKTATLVADEDTYSVALASFQPRRIMRVRFLDPATEESKDFNAGREIYPTEYELLYDVNGAVVVPPALPVYEYQIRFATSAVPNASEAGFTLVADIAYVPSEGEDVLPDEFLSRWSDAIRYRAMHELLVLPNRPWSSDLLAERYLEMYRNEVAAGIFEKNHMHKAVNLRMQAPSFI